MSTAVTAEKADLIHAIKELLKKSGQLNKMQAEVLKREPAHLTLAKLTSKEMRAKVTEALKQRQDNLKSGVNCTPPTPTDDVLLVNDLVLEYLEWTGYLYTASVMSSEANMPVEKRSRSDLCNSVGVKDDEKSVALPLLSNIVAAYTERIKRKINKNAKKDC